MELDNENYFGVVRWCSEDVACALIQHGIEPTEENIALVVNRLRHHSFTDLMIERGWEYIDDVISNADDNDEFAVKERST